MLNGRPGGERAEPPKVPAMRSIVEKAAQAGAVFLHENEKGGPAGPPFRFVDRQRDLRGDLHLLDGNRNAV